MLSVICLLGSPQVFGTVLIRVRTYIQFSVLDAVLLSALRLTIKHPKKKTSSTRFSIVEYSLKQFYCCTISRDSVQNEFQHVVNDNHLKHSPSPSVAQLRADRPFVEDTKRYSAAVDRAIRLASMAYEDRRDSRAGGEADIREIRG